jgi:hypothetical protein
MLADYQVLVDDPVTDHQYVDARRRIGADVI